MALDDWLIIHPTWDNPYCKNKALYGVKLNVVFIKGIFRRESAPRIGGHFPCHPQADGSFPQIFLKFFTLTSLSRMILQVIRL